MSAPPRKRLDEMAGPGWMHTTVTLLRGIGILTAVLLLALGVVTGGFFLLLTSVLAAVAIAGGFLLARFVQRESWFERPRARPLSLLMVVALPVGLVVIAQLAGPLLTPPAAASSCFRGEVGREEEVSRPLAVDPRIGRMEFRLVVPELADGAFRWWVTDPLGQIRWGGRAETPGFTEQETLDSSTAGPLGGHWTVTARGETSHASYAIEWYGAPAGEEIRTDPPACPAA